MYFYEHMLDVFKLHMTSTICFLIFAFFISSDLDQKTPGRNNSTRAVLLVAVPKYEHLRVIVLLVLLHLWSCTIGPLLGRRERRPQSLTPLLLN